MSRDRCPFCDLPLARPVDALPCYTGGERTDLCWLDYNGGRCHGPSVDWRARALKAESRLKKLKEKR
jgi:hypothetical protein